ncbi:MAG: glycosyltransferase family protein [Candidatus Protochlamydia sp.]|nr:glycosyltransferase family protein [Candidatus Protochlamydia sp.]
MNTEIFVQARMGSTRLPGKVLKEVLGRPLLSYLIERLKRAKEADNLVILTTMQAADDPIIALCQDEGVPWFRGSEENVLERYFMAAQKREVDAIVRITSDCPLIDPEVVDDVIQTYKSAFPSFDYISNSLELSFPRGMDTEIFSFQALKTAFLANIGQEEKEHVTPYIYTHPELFKLKNVAHHPSLCNFRWTVDTPEDFKLIRLILEKLYPFNPKFSMKDILDLLEKYPEWNQINAHIEQRKLKFQRKQ